MEQFIITLAVGVIAVLSLILAIGLAIGIFNFIRNVLIDEDTRIFAMVMVAFVIVSYIVGRILIPYIR